MTIDLQLVTYATLLTWIMVVCAGLIRTKVWTPAGLKTAFGNRHDIAEPPEWIARVDRAAKNMLENFPLFVALVAVAHLGNRHGDRVDLGAQLFFWGRVAYWPVYVAGIAYLRTAIWGLSIVGLGLIFSAVIA
ncbi:MAG: MAPEG family protein [Kofleriaceae bacterium]